MKNKKEEKNRRIKNKTGEKIQSVGLKSSESSIEKRSGTFFENLPDLIRPGDLAQYLGLSVATIYDWHYRKNLRKIPEGLFLKINRLLYIRKYIFEKWISLSIPLICHNAGPI